MPRNPDSWCIIAGLWRRAGSRSRSTSCLSWILLVLWSSNEYLTSHTPLSALSSASKVLPPSPGMSAHADCPCSKFWEKQAGGTGGGSSPKRSFAEWLAGPSVLQTTSGGLFCIIIIICSNCLNCLFKKEGIHRAISAVCGITWGLHIWSSPAHLLFRILIQACLFHNSELLFLYYFYPLPSFFPLYIACPVQQMWGSDPTSIEVNSQIPIDFTESESESVWGVRIRAK